MLVRAEPDDAESEESSDDEEDRRKIELSGIQRSINELDRLAIYIRQSSTSSLDARVKAFGARKLAEISPFETRAMVLINGLYPDASESIRQRLRKSMTERYTRLLYWKFHNKKLGANRHRDMQSRDDLSKAQPTPTPATERLQRHQSIKNDSSATPMPEASRVSKGTTFLSGTIPSNAGSQLIMPPSEGELPVRRRAGTPTVRNSRAKFPPPPKFEGGEYSKACPLCRKKFTKAEFGDILWWK